ncbi:uncharacterized protein LOC113344214 [Papaver somniferum]|uniref:uncharacterized protein LOC113344214 n=1 Tax=Papaver somniferum TaxID=3469 RepID=UPI000E703290|nr:uncharacterized protein LOC113344214 [Papaver somniferum]
MGFSTKWYKWIRFGYSTASFSVLINGSAFGFFKSKRGVRQGCPMFPLLFNIDMEGFSRYLDRDASLGLFNGFSVVNDGLVVNYLHYADDTIFFLDNKKEELTNLFSTLHVFEFIAGLNVNTSKTRIIAIEEVSELNALEDEFGCKTDTLPFLYLRMPLGAKPSSTTIWNPILERWRGETSLMNSFNDLYKLDRLRNATIAEHITVEGSWKFDFKRILTYGEANSLAALFHFIGYDPPAMDTLPDTRRWPLHSGGIFSVKTLYAKMIYDDGIDNSPYNFVWVSGIPPKVNFLLWCAVYGKLNSQDMIQYKGIDIHSSCILCGDCNESQDHILIHCKVAHKIWSSITPNEQWAWVFLESMLSLASAWFNNKLSTSGKVVWNIIPAAVVWVLWKERNCRTFEENYNYKTDEELCIEAKSLVLTWAASFGITIYVNYFYSIRN